MGELVDKVRNQISDYLGFDVDELFKLGDPYIYGGAVRDSIADMEIHDVDILVSPKTCKKICEYLPTIGYERHDLVKRDIMASYVGLSVMNEPLTFINNEGKVIQLIRPNGNINEREKALNFLKEVDLGCCGVYYDGEEVLESCENSIIQCKSKQFMVYINNKLSHQNRIYMRIKKLEDRGWSKVDHERDLVINHIINER